MSERLNAEILAELRELKALITQLLSKPRKLPLLPYAEAARHLVGSDSQSDQMKLRRRVKSGLYRLDKEVFDLAEENAKKQHLHFDIEACQQRERVPRHLR